MGFRALHLLVPRRSRDPRFVTALQEARVKAGLGQTELARRAQTTRATLYKLETRRPQPTGRPYACRPELAWRVAKALGLADVDPLFVPVSKEEQESAG